GRGNGIHSGDGARDRRRRGVQRRDGGGRTGRGIRRSGRRSVTKSAAPKKLRVYEVGKDLGMSSEAILQIVKRLGVDVKNHMSTLAPEVVDKIRGELAHEKQNVRDEDQRKHEHELARAREERARAAAAAAAASAAAPVATPPAQKSPTAPPSTPRPGTPPMGAPRPGSAPGGSRPMTPQGGPRSGGFGSGRPGGGGPTGRPGGGPGGGHRPGGPGGGRPGDFRGRRRDKK